MKALAETNRMFYFFDEISKIPRCSYNEGKIADYLETFAKQRGLEYVRDGENNVVIKKSGTKGKEFEEAVLLQGHSDMVCVSAENVDFDFDTQAIQLLVDGDFLKADGTTLGGDDGIAVAMMLAILDDKDAVHPPIEALMTTGEEVGLLGAKAVDGSIFKATRLINIDSEEEGVFTASCAGGLRQHVKLPLSKENNSFKHCYSLSVSGLLGGHSGMEIHKQRANAMKLLVRLISKVDTPFAFIGANGGEAMNSIPKQAVFTLVTDAGIAEFSAAAEKIKSEFIGKEPSINFEVKELDNPSECYSTKDSKVLYNLLYALPHGVIAMSDQIEGLVETSVNMATITTSENEAVIECNHRSSMNEKIHAVAKRVTAIAELAGARTELGSEYPGWAYAEKSPLRDTLLEVYEKMYGKKAEVAALHAGLECGVLGESIGKLDMISMGCNLYDVHTPNEKMDIASATRTFDFLKAVLEKI